MSIFNGPTTSFSIRTKIHRSVLFSIDFTFYPTLSNLLLSCYSSLSFIFSTASIFWFFLDKSFNIWIYISLQDMVMYYYNYESWRKRHSILRRRVRHCCRRRGAVVTTMVSAGFCEIQMKVGWSLPYVTDNQTVTTAFLAFSPLSIWMKTFPSLNYDAIALCEIKSFRLGELKRNLQYVSLTWFVIEFIVLYLSDNKLHICSYDLMVIHFALCHSLLQKRLKLSSVKYVIVRKKTIWLAKAENSQKQRKESSFTNINDSLTASICQIFNMTYFWRIKH